MPNYKVKIFATLCSILLISGFFCPINGQDCNKIPSVFSSYEQAKQIVQSATFKIKDNIDTTKSSWIRGASFYSCDGKKGFLIIKTDARDYIHQNVPIEVWRGFKNADSFGNYYNSYLKGNYRLSLSQQPS